MSIHSNAYIKLNENVALDADQAPRIKNFPHRVLYEGEDVRTLLNLPGVDREDGLRVVVRVTIDGEIPARKVGTVSIQEDPHFSNAADWSAGRDSPARSDEN